MQDAKSMLEEKLDADMRDMVKEELHELEATSRQSLKIK